MHTSGGCGDGREVLVMVYSDDRMVAQRDNGRSGDAGRLYTDGGDKK